MGVCRTASTSVTFAKLVNPLLCVVLLFGLLYFGKEIFRPFAFSCLLALLLMAPCRMLEKRGVPRTLASLISLFMGLVLFLVVFYFISNSIMGFKKDAPLMIANLKSTILHFENWIQSKFHLSTEKMQALVNSSSMLPSASNIVNATVSTITSAFFVFIIVIINTFLLLLYRGLIVRFFTHLFADEHTDRIHGIFLKTRFVIRSYIVGLFIEMLIVAIANCSAFYFLGIKYAFLLGIIAAILNLIPYLGIFMACIISVLITFTTNSPGAVTGVIITLFIIHILDSNVLMPKVVGSKVKINALATVVGVITGSALWGIPGMFMAVPIIAILKVLFEDVEALHPFAILLGDDHTLTSPYKPIIKKITYIVQKPRTKKEST